MTEQGSPDEDQDIVTHAYIRADPERHDDSYDCPLIWESGVLNSKEEFICEKTYRPGEYFLNPGFLIIQLHNIDGDRRLEHSS